MFDPGQDLDLSALPILAGFEGVGPRVRSVLESKTLERLHWTRPPVDPVVHARGPIRRVELREMGKRRSIPVLSHPQTLQEVVFANAEEVDMSPLAATPHLSALTVYRCRKLSSISSLVALQSLEYIELQQVDEIPEWHELARIHANEAVAQKVRSLGPDFVDRAFKESGTHWAVAK
jgi:hypothetical protein